jgi:hypothetical protein
MLGASVPDLSIDDDEPVPAKKDEEETGEVQPTKQILDFFTD